MTKTANPAADFAEINGMEIFTGGDYGKRGNYNESIMDAIVNRFKSAGHSVPMVVGHSEKQEWLRDTGLPAAGWLTSLRRVGNKLLADARDVPRVVANAINSKALPQRSAEFYGTRNADGVIQPTGLRRLALMGGCPPQCKNLNDVVALYGDGDDTQENVWVEFASDSPESNSISIVEGTTMAPENKTPDKTGDQVAQFTEADVTAMIAKAVAPFQDKLDKSSATVESQGKIITSLTTRLDTQARNADKRDVAAFCDRLKTAKKYPPVLDDLGAPAFLESLDNTETAKFAEGDDAPTVTPRQWFMTFLEKIADNTAIKFGEKIEQTGKPSAALVECETADGKKFKASRELVAHFNENEADYARIGTTLFDLANAEPVYGPTVESN